MITADDDLREAYVNWCETHPDDLNSALPVSEVFGPTIQGEGPHMGRPCWFIRTGGCNLSCTWCDTPYSTGQHSIPLSTVPKRTARSVANAIPAGTMVVLTGGEPLMHIKRPAMIALLHALHAKGCEVHMETNGSILPDMSVGYLIDHYTVSPKLGVEMVNPRHNPALQDWTRYADRTIFKFVIDRLDEDDQDVNLRAQYALMTAETHGGAKESVWIMPEGATAPELAVHWAEVAQAAADAGINASHRLHALAWGDAKGH